MGSNPLYGGKNRPAMHCDFTVAMESFYRFAISGCDSLSPKHSPKMRRISGDLAPSTRKSHSDCDCAILVSATREKAPERTRCSLKKNPTCLVRNKEAIAWAFPSGDSRDDARPFNSSLRQEKLQNESSPNFKLFFEFGSRILPRISAPDFPPNFSRIVRASFRGKRRPEKIHQKSPPFFNAKFPGRYGKKKSSHKMFLERRQSKKPYFLSLI